MAEPPPDAQPGPGQDTAPSGNDGAGREGPADLAVASGNGGPGRGDLGNLKPMLETIGLVVAPVSLIASVLIYFGRVRTTTEARFYGLDPSIYGYSNQDHIVRSIAPMLGPLAVGGVAVVLVVTANGLLGRRAHDLVGSDRDTSLTIWAGRICAAVGIALMIAGATWQAVLGSHHSYWAPLLLGTGGFALAAGLGTRAMIDEHQRAPDDPTSPAKALPAALKLAIGFVVVFAAFGLVARIAQSEGFDRAKAAVEDLDTKPRVTVLSEHVLDIRHRGVACFELRDSRFIRKYTGLHLLAHRNGRYILVAGAFDTINAVTIVLPDDPTLRVEHDASPQLRDAAGVPPESPITSPDADLIC